MWAELAWAELVLGRVVRNSFRPRMFWPQKMRKAGVSVKGVDPKHVFMHTYVMHFLGLKV